MNSKKVHNRRKKTNKTVFAVPTGKIRKCGERDQTPAERVVITIHLRFLLFLFKKYEIL